MTSVAISPKPTIVKQYQTQLFDINAHLDQRVLDCALYKEAPAFRAQQRLTRVLGDAGLHFEGKPYPVCLRPYAMTNSEAKSVISVAERLVEILDIAAVIYCEDSRAQQLFPTCESVTTFIKALPKIRPLVRVCRLDGLIAADGTYRLLETNTDCPGGVIQNGMAARIWSGEVNPLTVGLDLDVTTQPFAVDSDCFLHELLNSHYLRTGQSAQRSLIVNYRGRYTNETDWMVRGLRRLGLDADLADAGQLSRGPGGLRDTFGKIVDLTYNKYELRDFINEPDVVPYMAAAAADEVTFVNPLIAQWVLADKAIFALLTDERFAEYFSASERDLIRRHIPWTRVVTGGTTTGPDGSRVDLQKYILEKRQSLVLKPVNGTRGEGVLIGCQTDDGTWRDCLCEALRTKPYIAQDYIEAPRIWTLHPDMGSMNMASGLDVYVFGGHFAGFQARASIDPVMNIGRRGVLLPVAITGANNYVH